VKGGVGAQALGGYVATNIAYTSDDSAGSILASYVLVFTLYGELARVVPTYIGGVMYRPLGLKLRNSTTLLLAAGKEEDMVGYRALYNYKDDTFEWIAGEEKGDAHDIQWAYSGDAFWQPTLSEFSAADGTRRVDVDVQNTGDVNHCQLIEDDAKAVISSRLTNSIVKVDVASGAVAWTLGGDEGTIPILALDGTVYGAGSSYFVGQHNAEYFGEGEYLMFDNQLGMGGDSRLLILSYSEGADYAEETWEYWVDGYTPHFGDNDRLPTGNLLGCYWPEVVTDDSEYDELIFEVVRSTKATAWQLKVAGAKCHASSCNRGESGEGWTAYSVERFYTQPLVYDVSCNATGRDGGAKYALAFTAQNNYKQNDKYSASFTVASAGGGGDELASGTFEFEAHWRATSVSSTFEDESDDDDDDDGDVQYYVTVTNQWGDSTQAGFSCSG